MVCWLLLAIKTISGEGAKEIVISDKRVYVIYHDTYGEYSLTSVS